MGPTAAGKSELAMRLAAALPVEIVSVDSAQVYRGMDIGTAKPSAHERAQVEHHLIDIVEPTEAYSAARFVDEAMAHVRAVQGRGRVPLLVGGTMLYFHALRDGLAGLPPADAALRAELEAEAARLGWAKLHARLAALDPATAARLEPTDSQRIQRSLEVCLLTGTPMSLLLRRDRRESLLGRHLAIALLPGDRAELHRRIASRFERMLDAGLVEELRLLRRRHVLHAALPAMRCVGYRQAWEYLEERIDMAALSAHGIAATRQLAKRQLTWLRRTPARPFDCLDPELAGAVLSWLRS